MPYNFRAPDSAYQSGNPGAGLWFDTATTAVSLEYDLRNRGVLIAVSPQTAGSSSATHWWLDWETKSLWKVVWGSTNQEPFCQHARRNFIAESAAHSTVMLGGRNGYIYRFQNSVNSDDSNTFTSYIWFGPFEDASMFSDVIITELVAELARKGGEVLWEIYVGETPEEAFVATPRESGVWVAGRNYVTNPRTRGASQYIKITSLDATGWGFERAYAILQNAGRHRP